MKIHFAISAFVYDYLIAVLTWNEIEAQRIVLVPPHVTDRKISFNVLPGRYFVRMYSSETGVTLDKAFERFLYK